jgi:tRNA G18 (ribose-2'-O)-methylase SpoU
MTKKLEITVILNNIRSSENVGSIFRSCDAAGVSKIILCGYTPAPFDRFGRENKGLIKASLGAEKFVEWEKAENLKEAIQNFSSEYSQKCLASATGASTRKNSAEFYPCIFENIPKKNFESAHSKNFVIVGVEQNKNSVNYRDIKKLAPRASRLALIFGNEVEGLSETDLKLCDLIAEIPMHGHKESLNVAVAAGIVLFEILK